MSNKIGLLSMEKFENRSKGTVGSSRIRVDWLAKYWDEAEEFIIGKDYDVVVYQKAYFEGHIKNFKGIKIFDLCDPDWIEGRPVMELAEYLDAFVVSSQGLKDQLEKYVDIPVVLIPDRMDVDFYKNPKPTHEGRAKKAVYFGYSHNADRVLPQTLEALKTYGISLTVISDKPFSYSGFYDCTNINYDNATVNEEIIRNDFVLLPDFNDLRAKYKSNNKDISSWFLKMPVVKSEADFERFLSPDNRNKEAEEKHKFVMENYRVEKSVEEYKQLIDTLKASKISKK